MASPSLAVALEKRYSDFPNIIPHLETATMLGFLTQLLQQQTVNSSEAAWSCSSWPADCSKALATVLVQHQPAPAALVEFCSSMQQQHTLAQLLQACSNISSAAAIAQAVVHAVMPRCPWLASHTDAVFEACIHRLEVLGHGVQEIEVLLALQDECLMSEQDPARCQQVLERLVPPAWHTHAVLFEGKLSDATRRALTLPTAADPDAQRLLALTDQQHAASGWHSCCMCLVSFNILALQELVLAGDVTAKGALNHLLLQAFQMGNSRGLQTVLVPGQTALVDTFSSSSEEAAVHESGRVRGPVADCLQQQAAHSSVPCVASLQPVKFVSGSSSSPYLPAGITAMLPSGVQVACHAFTEPFGVMTTPDTSKGCYVHAARLALAVQGLLSPSRPWVYQQGTAGTVARPLLACCVKLDDAGLLSWVMHATPSRVCLPLVAHWLLGLVPQLGLELAAWEAHPKRWPTAVYISALATAVPGAIRKAADADAAAGLPAADADAAVGPPAAAADAAVGPPAAAADAAVGLPATSADAAVGPPAAAAHADAAVGLPAAVAGGGRGNRGRGRGPAAGRGSCRAGKEVGAKRRTDGDGEEVRATRRRTVPSRFQDGFEGNL